MTKPKFYWYNNSLLIINPTKSIEDFLVYYKKSLEVIPGKFERKSSLKKQLLFNVVHPGPENRTIQTLQGFKNKLVAIAAKDGEFEFHDHRLKSPEPRYNLMYGFRFGQEGLLRQALMKNQSGLIQAPTRYGKTYLIANTLRAFPGVQAVVAAPGVDLLGQTVNQLQELLCEREVKGIFTGSRNRNPSSDITVCSLDSLTKLDIEGTKLLLIDEPHAAVSESRAPVLARFKNARIYGFGATLKGRYDGADKLITGIMGPILSKITFREAVKEEAICDIKVFMVKVPFEHFPAAKRDTAYNRLVYKNQNFFSIIQEVSKTIIPEEWQTLIFIDQKKQADLMAKFVTSSEVAIAGRMTKAGRKEMFEAMQANEIKRCICTDIYAQGVTFPDLRVLVNAAGGGGHIASTQKPGRLAQVRPGKARGYLVDFLFECVDGEDEHGQTVHSAWNHVVRDCAARMKQYKTLGYDVQVVDSITEITLE